jgi:hypothetical protein
VGIISRGSTVSIDNPAGSGPGGDGACAGTGGVKGCAAGGALVRDLRRADARGRR